MKRRAYSKSIINHDRPNHDKIVISSEHFGEEKPSYICSICNMTLSRLTDSGGNNSTYWCRNCSVEFDPELENIRKESKISVPDRNIEPCVSTTPGIRDISIRHTPELKGGFAALSKKGTIRFTSYQYSSQR
ncbi:MAG TPA: hypothetical protein VFY68_03790 [Nitrososphaeraceae archaeon]|nr:hypothetical protein [Nitrososphaeraceae archaeon]